MTQQEKNIDHQTIFATIGDRYEMIRQIGRGGMGVVYLAQDKKLNRYVACKRLLLQNANRNTIQRRFLKEAQTIASLGHIHIVNIYDIGRDEHGYYITMEYVAGPATSDEGLMLKPPPPVTLQDYIKNVGPMEVDQARRLIVKLCSALEYAHQQGIIHRDIKPANILLNERYEPKLVDFGLALPLNLKEHTEITLEGEFLGTPEYVAPEQWSEGTKVDKRADIYAIGGIFWFMLTGKLPRYFRESDVPEELKPIISKALAHKRSERFNSAQELALELKKLSQSGSFEKSKEAPNRELDPDHWSCPNCKSLNPSKANYCIRCGSYGLQNCPTCKSEFRFGSRHCPHCGVDIQQAEEAASIIAEAENYAAFLEFETAANVIKDLDGKHYPEASALVKEWRQVGLKRRSLLTELDSTIRVFNVTNAVKIHKELKKLIPEDCLSDSLDFDVVVNFSTLENELINLLKDFAGRAKDDYDLDKFSQNIEYLNEVCGPEACTAINSELAQISSSLDNIVTKSGLAIGMNCLSRGLDILLSISPWKGSELGERRNRMIARCKELIREREQIIDNLEEAVRKSQYTVALQIIHETSRFRLPPNYSEMEPGDDDLAANDRISQADKILRSKFEEKIPIWVENDKWDEIKNAFSTFSGEEDSNWKRLNDELRSRVNKKIANRYNFGVDCETKGRVSQAENAWKEFLKIPQGLMPTNLWDYATNFEHRKRVFLQSKRNKTIHRVLLIALISWAYPVFIKVLPLLFKSYTRDQLTGQFMLHFLPGVLNFAIFLIFSAILISEKMVKAELRRARFSSTRIHMLFFLLACSPLSFIFHEIVQWTLSHYSLPLESWYPLIILTLFWFVFDLFRRYFWHIKGIFSLSIAWIITSIIGHFSKTLFVGGYERWPTMLLVHGVIYALLLIPERTVSQNRS